MSFVLREMTRSPLMYRGQGFNSRAAAVSDMKASGERINFTLFVGRRTCRDDNLCLIHVIRSDSMQSSSGRHLAGALRGKLESPKSYASFFSDFSRAACAGIEYRRGECRFVTAIRNSSPAAF